MSARGSALAGFAVALPLLVLRALPLAAIVGSSSIEGLRTAVTTPSFASALQLSLQTSMCALALVIVGGTPLAWWLARRSGRARDLISTLVELPILLPPAVVGLGLLLAFGKSSPLGQALDALGLSPVFRPAAVVIAQTVVAAPFFVQAATMAFRRVEPQTMLVAQTLGASPSQAFWRVAMPLALPGLIGGAALAWARALGEFGATLLFAGNLEGVTQSMPLAIYAALDGELSVALALSLVLATAGVAVLVLVRWLGARAQSGRAAPSPRGQAAPTAPKTGGHE